MTPMEFERVEALPSVPKRPNDSHKGMYGSLLVVAGGRGMAGAAALVGASALRSGAGLVRVASPAEVQPTVATFEPSYMTWPLPCDARGFLDFPACRSDLDELLGMADVLAIGPGLGRTDGVRAAVRWLLAEASLPTVLDADGLNAIADEPSLLKSLKRPVIVTPHPGEFARLTGRSTSEVRADREGSALALAQSENLIVVLKGDRTVVTDGRRLYVNTTGNPGMATGGTGDCLTGVIAAMVGQKLPPFEAAMLGVYAHGLAGDIARDQNGILGLIAGDIVDSLADAFDHLSRD
jgi:ADP-dependent NAD(P)H-hydrate dehydratase